MFRKHVPAPIRVSPSVFRYSPEALASVDVSFESYKQKGPRKRSISPMINEQFMRSPNLSPIAMNRAFNVSSRSNTPSSFRDRNEKLPAKRNNYLGAGTPNMSSSLNLSDHQAAGRPYLCNTPLAKRQLEHRVSVGNILLDMKLAQYVEIFVREEIDFEVFLTLSEQDLHDIGIHCQRDCEVILAKVAEYNSCV